MVKLPANLTNQSSAIITRTGVFVESETMILMIPLIIGVVVAVMLIVIPEISSIMLIYRV